MGSAAQQFESDFDFTCNLMGEFFSQRRVQRTLNLIEEYGLTGWEKWWQIELAIFVADHPEIAEWNVEESLLHRSPIRNPEGHNCC